MKKSRHFSELAASYLAEIDDLSFDSEGKPVLKKRLSEKRRELHALLPMMEFSPEMVAVAFYDAFAFTAPALMPPLVSSEPGERGFLSWAQMENSLDVADWARPLVASALAAEGGDVFLVTTAALEFLRTHDGAEAPEPRHEASDAPETDEDEEDLSESGAEWMAEQGFDPLES